MSALRQPRSRLLIALALLAMAMVVALQTAAATRNAMEHAPGVTHAGSLAGAAHAAAHHAVTDPHTAIDDHGASGVGAEATADETRSAPHHHHADAPHLAPLLPLEFTRQALTCTPATFMDCARGSRSRLAAAHERPPRAKPLVRTA